MCGGVLVVPSDRSLFAQVYGHSLGSSSFRLPDHVFRPCNTNGGTAAAQLVCTNPCLQGTDGRQLRVHVSTSTCSNRSAMAVRKRDFRKANLSRSLRDVSWRLSRATSANGEPPKSVRGSEWG
jgi:hypothetical protein